MQAVSQSYREHLPARPLARDASCVWILEVSAGGPAYEHRTVPNGCIELAYMMGTDVVTVTGMQRRPNVSRVEPGTTVVGLRLRPGTSPSILGATPTELVDLDVRLDDLWDRRAAMLADTLVEARSAADAAHLLQREVARRAVDSAETDPLVAAAIGRLQPWRRGDLATWAADLFISPRQLRRRFVAALGYGPKTFQRIRRFQGFLALSHAQHGDLARLAREAGYADQPHLTRECRQLTGLTPARFLEETRESCGPSHDHDVSYAGLRRALLATVPEGRTGS
jgi:AraC-like DNA-binding protein